MRPVPADPPCSGIARAIIGLLAGLLATPAMAGADAGPDASFPAPQELAFAPDGRQLAVADAGCDAVRLIDPAHGFLVRSVRLAGRARGLAWREGRLLAAEYGAGTVAEIDPASGAVLRRLAVGPTPWGLALATGRDLLLAADPGLGLVASIGLTDGAVARTVAAAAPRHLAVTSDGTLAVVAHALPDGDATRPDHAATLTILDLGTLSRIADVALPAGSTNLRELRLSADGRWAYVVHTLGKVTLPTFQVTRGWVSTNVLSIIDVRARERFATVLLDTATAGAADPWGLALGEDGRTAWIALAGVHQLARLDLGRLHALLDPAQPLAEADAARWRRFRDPLLRRSDLQLDLTLLPASGLLRRMPLPGEGPRGLALAPDGRLLAVAMHFSGEVLLLDPGRPDHEPRRIPLPSPGAITAVRRGEAAFHDARTTQQGWLSCATCHPGGRADGLLWDLPNDGIGNPKNTKSLVLSARTPPAMWLGVRASMEVAAEKGFHFIAFTQPDPQVLADTRTYIAALAPESNPHLLAGAPSPQAEAGRRLFTDARVGCMSCHAPPLFTDLKMHAVGTALPGEKAERFDTPTLRELWATAPYLHGGQAATLRDLLTTGNAHDRHGRTSQLTPAEIDALVAYLQSL